METTDGGAPEPLRRALAIAGDIVRRAKWMIADRGVFSPPDLSDLRDICERGAVLYEHILQGMSRLSDSREESPRDAPEAMAKALMGAVFPAVRRVGDLVRKARDSAGFPVDFSGRVGGGGPGDALWMDLGMLEHSLEAHGIPPEDSPSTVLGRILDTLGQIEARLAAPQPFLSREEPVAVDELDTMPGRFELPTAPSREERADMTPTERPPVPPKLVRPSTAAFAAYFLHRVGGMRQKEVAAELTKRFRGPIKQFQISRMCKKVDRYLGAGGPAPDWSVYNQGPGGRVRLMDPRSLEAMENADPAREHRTGDAEEGVGESYAP